ncbi:MAG: DNA-directed RNA polymerase subunit L [Candidatus Aenigmarchaeota archaeon]|nr:DNA-directed RNA polymerase subunit L [Candidatus Aenigmarchaeota archaeon]
MTNKIIKETKNSLVVEMDSLTLANLLNEYLWSIKGIKFAGFSKEHPYLSKPKLLVNATDPKKALKSAVERILKDVEELRKQVKKI